MITLHTLPQSTIATLPILDATISDQRPQLLFALLDGISLGILSMSSESAASRSAARRSISIRAVLLIALGLILTLWGTGVIVILDYYGFFFLLTLPMLFVSRGVLLGTSVGLAILGPFLVTAFIGLIDGVTIPTVLQLIATWSFVGQYPAAIWMAYILFGLWMQRSGLLTPRKTLPLALAAFVIAIGTAVAAPMVVTYTPELSIAITGISAGAMGAALIWVLIAALKQVTGASRRVAVLAISIGSMPLSVYVLHVLLISLIVEASGIAGLQGWTSFVFVLLACVLFAVVWRWFFVRGPIEQFARWMTSQTEKLPVTFSR
ncbi:DUF418 domain-containing protein [Microbacterium sp. ZW CA_36]|uniref:DUF418 domain-containing protein n=1 Tax=Microbacterium sp. ZW CA_36 TaxID=3378078 RepID=UPI003852AD32